MLTELNNKIVWCVKWERVVSAALIQEHLERFFTHLSPPNCFLRLWLNLQEFQLHGCSIDWSFIEDNLLFTLEKRPRC